MIEQLLDTIFELKERNEFKLLPDSEITSIALKLLQLEELADINRHLDFIGDEI